MENEKISCLRLNFRPSWRIPVDELIERLILIAKIDKGRQNVKDGKINTNEQAKAKLGKWLSWFGQTRQIGDLESIGDYIAENSDENSEKYAKLTIQRIFEKTSILENYPEAGRIVPEKNEENVRELIEGNYRIIYEIISEDLIYILTVYHSARNLKS